MKGTIQVEMKMSLEDLKRIGNDYVDFYLQGYNDAIETLRSAQIKGDEEKEMRERVETIIIRDYGDKI